MVKKTKPKKTKPKKTKSGGTKRGGTKLGGTKRVGGGGAEHDLLQETGNPIAAPQQPPPQPAPQNLNWMKYFAVVLALLALLAIAYYAWSNSSDGKNRRKTCNDGNDGNAFVCGDGKTLKINNPICNDLHGCTEDRCCQSTHTTPPTTTTSPQGLRKTRANNFPTIKNPTSRLHLNLFSNKYKDNNDNYTDNNDNNTGNNYETHIQKNDNRVKSTGTYGNMVTSEKSTDIPSLDQ